MWNGWSIAEVGELRLAYQVLDGDAQQLISYLPADRAAELAWARFGARRRRILATSRTGLSAELI